MKLFYYTVLLFILFSCKNDVVYDKMDKHFKLNRWDKTDVKNYNFTIENSLEQYDIIFKFGHVYDYQFPFIPLKIKIENPSGTIESIDVNLKIKDPNGKELADCGLDICDLKQVIKKKTKLERGNYKISVSHNFKGSYLPNVLGVGLQIKKVQQ
jgi:gliding motility-associated lipoprotein GldH